MGYGIEFKSRTKLTKLINELSDIKSPTPDDLIVLGLARATLAVYKLHLDMENTLHEAIEKREAK